MLYLYLKETLDVFLKRPASLIYFNGFNFHASNVRVFSQQNSSSHDLQQHGHISCIFRSDS